MATPLTLYYAAGTCAQAVLIALHEAGAQFTLKTLSFADNIRVLSGETFEIAVDAFGAPLRNSLRVEPATLPVVKPL